MVECIRGGMCHAIHLYAKANNKNMQDFDPDKESSYLMHLDVNNLYGWAMSQKLSMDAFELRKDLFRFGEDYDKDSDKGYILEVDVDYHKELQKEHSDLPFLSKRMKIDSCEKLVCNLQDRKHCVIHIRALKQELYCGLVLERVHGAIEFNQETWLTPYIDMHTELITKAKKYFEADFFKLMNNSVFGKIMKNVTKHRHIKLVTTNKRRSDLVLEANYHKTKWFSENLLAIELSKMEVRWCISVYQL